MTRGWCLLLLVAAGVAGCGHRIPLQSRADGVGSEGRITVVEKQYGIRVVKVRIDDLVDPGDVAPAARSYVVWARRAEGYVENVGAMRLQDDGGVLEAVAPSGQFRLFVTAEPSEEARAPSSNPIFFADVAK